MLRPAKNGCTCRCHAGVGMMHVKDCCQTNPQPKCESIEATKDMNHMVFVPAWRQTPAEVKEKLAKGELELAFVTTGDFSGRGIKPGAYYRQTKTAA